MSAVEYADHQRAVRWMEDDEARRRGCRIVEARPFVARDIGLSPGTLEDIRKGRLKSLRGRVERAIDAALVRFLRRQQDDLTKQLELAEARLHRGPTGVVERALAAREELASLIAEAEGCRR